MIKKECMLRLQQDYAQVSQANVGENYVVR